MDKEKLPWRSFANGGAIFPKWGLDGTPTLYVLDHKGVIRHKWAGSPGEKGIEAALEKLIQEAEQDGKDAATQQAIADWHYWVQRGYHFWSDDDA
jgi:hypothetical protein